MFATRRVFDPVVALQDLEHRSGDGRILGKAFHGGGENPGEGGGDRENQGRLAVKGGHSGEQFAMLEAFRAAEVECGHRAAFVGQRGQDRVDHIAAIDGLLKRATPSNQGNNPALRLGAQRRGCKIIRPKHHGNPQNRGRNPALEEYAFGESFGIETGIASAGPGAENAEIDDASAARLGADLFQNATGFFVGRGVGRPFAFLDNTHQMNHARAAGDGLAHGLDLGVVAHHDLGSAGGRKVSDSASGGFRAHQRADDGAFAAIFVGHVAEPADQLSPQVPVGAGDQNSLG